MEKGQLAEGITQYQGTLNINPDYAPAHLGLGIALSRAGYVDTAIAHYQQALADQPQL